MNTWNLAATPPPMRGPGIPSAPVLALLDTGAVIAAEFWQSSAEGQPPKWYISKTIHLYPEPFLEICETVIGWLEITEYIYTPVGTAVKTKTLEVKA
jgi:hypothetical protein